MPDVADLAPSDPALTDYDEQHATTNIVSSHLAAAQTKRAPESPPARVPRFVYRSAYRAELGRPRGGLQRRLSAVPAIPASHCFGRLKLRGPARPTDAEGADWREVVRIVLHIDPDREPDRARQAFNSHLARAK
jgi:hypothetical protein